jgi:nucleoid-associated protein YgaU
MRKNIIALLFVPGLLSWPALADELRLQDDPPAQYIVVKGDTLWGISGRFLKEPWRWPEIWKMNREQIRNPHLIYPGDLIVLDTTGDSPQLRLVKKEMADASLPAEKLTPKVRTEAMETQAVPSIPPAAIGPFLSQPLVLEEDALATAPFIVAAEEEGRVVMGAGDKAYAVAPEETKALGWKIVRPGKVLADPDSGEVLGHEAEYIGEARTVESGNPQTILITKAAKEVNFRDRLVPAAETEVFKYIPHAPEHSISGRVISAYEGVAEVGQYATVVLNKGRRDSLEEGHVLAVYRKGQTTKEGVNLPDTRTGLIFVYRVFDRVSYALVMQVSRPVYLLDVARNP